MMKIECTATKISEDLLAQVTSIFQSLGAESLRVLGTTQERGAGNSTGWRVRELRNARGALLLVQHGTSKGDRHTCRVEWTGEGVRDALASYGNNWQPLPVAIKTGKSKAAITAVEDVAVFDPAKFWIPKHVEEVRGLLPPQWTLLDLQTATALVLAETDWNDDATALKLSVGYLKDQLVPVVAPTALSLSIAELGTHLTATVKLVQRRDGLLQKRQQLTGELEATRRKIENVEGGERPKFDEDDRADVAKKFYDQQLAVVNELEKGLREARRKLDEQKADHNKAMTALQQRTAAYYEEARQPLVADVDRINRELTELDLELGQVDASLQAPECQTALSLRELVSATIS